MPSTSRVKKYITQDFKKNKTSIKSLIIIFFYRFSAFFAQNESRAVRIFGIPVRLAYKFAIEIIMGVELPDTVRSGEGLAVYHGVGLVVNAETTIGRNVTLRQNVTIGTKRPGESPPTIGNDVTIGANAVILGEITVGSGSIIGAGAVLARSCPENSTVLAPFATIKVRSESKAESPTLK